MFVGVDGCKQGWIAVTVDAAGFVAASVHGHFTELLAAHEGASVLGVDMPIGLLETAPRGADVRARAFLKGQGSSVFAAPVRAVLSASSHEAASERARALTGKGLSRQSFNLFAKIREVDAHAGDARICEVHPEVSFQTMSAGEPLGSKKTYGGMRARLALLAHHGIDLPTSLGPVDAVGTDDVIDAAAAAWSARRIAQGVAKRLGDPDERDPLHGRVIGIWA